MDTSPEPPYVAGSAQFLDAAFDVALSCNIRIIISIHAARGSQNGYDHSAPRDRYEEMLCFVSDSRIISLVPVLSLQIH